MPDAPPSATSRIRPPKEEPKKAPPKRSPKKLASDIADQLTACGMMIGQPDPVAGYILVSNAENFGEAWADVAEVNPRVKAILERWFSKTVYAGAAMASAAIVLPLATHYGLMPRAWYNPASETVGQLEGLVKEQGVSFTDLLMMDAKMKEAAAAFQEEAAFHAGMGSNGNGPEHETPDHYEVPVA